MKGGVVLVPGLVDPTGFELASAGVNPAEVDPYPHGPNHAARDETKNPPNANQCIWEDFGNTSM